MKNIIVLLLLLSVVPSFASMMDVASKLTKNADDLNGTISTMFKVSDKKYIEQAKLAMEAVCKESNAYKSLSAQNVWKEIQAAVKIQTLTTVNFMNTCDKTTSGNNDFCSNNNYELKEMYKKIQACVNVRIEERAPVLAAKLNKRKILSCTATNLYLDEIVRSFFKEDLIFANPKYADLSFDEVSKFEELEASYCKIGNKVVDIKETLIGNAFAKCIAPNKIFAMCLKASCNHKKIDGACFTQYKNKCLSELQTKAGYEIQDINRCYWNEVRYPTEAKTKKLNEDCRKTKSFAQLDSNLQDVAPGITYCDRSLENCINSVNQAFDLREGSDICISSSTYSTGNTNSGGSK